MKETGKQQKCELHNHPIIKIELNSHKLLCQKCTAQTDEERRQRLEIQRVRLHKTYQIALEDIKTAKETTDKLVELFQSKNMSEAKKLINKSSAEVQKLVEGLLEKELKEANRLLREAAEAEMEGWKMIDGRSFCSSYVQFEEECGRIEGRLNQLKQSLKQQISDKLKVEMRAFYSSLFEF